MLQQRRHGGGEQRHGGLLLRHVERRGDAGGLLEHQAAQYGLGIVEVVLRHRYPVARFQRLEIGDGDAAHDAEREGFAIVAAADGGGPGGVAGCAVLAPEIEFVAGAQDCVEGIAELRALEGDEAALARTAAGRIDRGQQGRAGDSRLGIRLLNAGDGAGDVVVAAFRLGDQLIEPG